MNEGEIRFGEVDLTTCDREPIHIPGSIQPHGVLLVVDRYGFAVEQVAGDTRSLLGFSPDEILRNSVCALFEPEIGIFIRSQLSTATSLLAPIIRLGIASRRSKQPLDLTLHSQGQTSIFELELASPRTATLVVEPIAQLKTLVAAVQATTSVDECCVAAAQALRAATGFDRAMIYRFLPDGSGMVAAEDATNGLESFLGLHYPASDIPKQARELYRRNWLRTIPDIAYVPQPLVPEKNPRTGQPIDMSHCGLRSVSPIHLEYLRNMGVCATLSASIVCRDQLWGMLVLHHYTPRYPAAELRIVCETFAQILSLQLEAGLKAESAVLQNDTRQVRENLITRLSGVSEIGGTLASWDLLSYVGASGAVICLDGRLRFVGETPTHEEILALVEWMNGIQEPLFATQHLAIAYPPAAEYAAVASGVLAVGLSREPRDYVMWFRREIGHTVRWAGDPGKPTRAERHGVRLTPRGSFAEWLEVTKMQAAPWSEVDLEAAGALRVVLLESILRSADLVRRERAIEAAKAVAEELERRVAQRTDQLRALVADLEATEDRQRRQIARDLHDDLGQTLAAARIRLTALCDDQRDDVSLQAQEVGALIDRASGAIHSLASHLAPDVLHELGLIPALEWLGEDIEHTFGLRVNMIDDGHPKPLAQETRSILYRAVRELLINVSRHAQTDSATVDSQCQDGRIIIRVSDSGVGFDTARVFGESRSGLGLISLRERLTLIGGSAEVHSVPGEGSHCVLTAPLEGAGSLPMEPRQ
jgi:two-component system, chemotaxis family, sensor kinase Cph1